MSGLNRGWGGVQAALEEEEMRERLRAVADTAHLRRNDGERLVLIRGYLDWCAKHEEAPTWSVVDTLSGRDLPEHHSK